MVARASFLGNANPAGRFRPDLPVLDNYEEKEPTQMSTALWCDKGNHAFSSKDQFKRHFSSTHDVQVPTGNSYGQPTYQVRHEITEELDICGPCWEKTNPFSADEDAPKEVEGPSKLDLLEKEKSDYERGFEAGEDHALYVGKHA